MIRDSAASDAEAMARMYNHYVLHSTVTFEQESVLAEEMEKRVEGVKASGFPWIVSAEGGEIDGYAYAHPWKSRCAYRFSVETSIYVAPDRCGRGVGTDLYLTLIDLLGPLGAHAVIAGISQPNPASVALHEKLGFRQVALFPQVGYKFGRWIDVGYWQLTL